MTQIEVRGTEALTRRLLELGQDAPRAATRAVNKTLASLKTATVRALAQNVGLRNSDVSPSIQISRATWSRQFGALVVTGKRVPLLAFGARGPEPSRGRGQGVTYRLPGGRGRAEHAFLATMRSGHRGVFQRRPGAGRLPITELFGPSLPHAMVSSGILAAQEANGETLLAKNMNHEIDWIIRQRVQAGDGSEG